MEINEYQKMALETAMYPKEFKTVYPALGMNGEAGEVADKVKKILRGDKGLIVRDSNGAIVIQDSEREELAKEIGDVLWYVATMSYDIGYSLEEIAGLNIRKLASRKNRGKLNGNGDNR